MKKRPHILERIIEQADLPDEVLPGQPLLELASDQRILVENHCGVTQYTKDSIHIRVNYGQLRISGKELHMCRISGSQLVITGTIQTVQVCRRECR